MLTVSDEIVAKVVIPGRTVVFTEPYGPVAVGSNGNNTVQVVMPGLKPEDPAQEYSVQLPPIVEHETHHPLLYAFVDNYVLHITNGITSKSIATRFPNSYYDLNCMNIFDMMQKGTTPINFSDKYISTSRNAFCGMDVRVSFTKKDGMDHVTIGIVDKTVSAPLIHNIHGWFYVYNNVIFATNGLDNVIAVIRMNSNKIPNTLTNGSISPDQLKDLLLVSFEDF